MENTVTVNFEVDDVVQAPGIASAGFVVDRKIDMLVADTGTFEDGRPNQQGRQLVYKVTNEGNAAQPYDINVVLTGSFGSGPINGISLDTNTDTLGANEYRVYISDDATLVLDGSDPVYDPTGFVLADTPAAFDDTASTDDEFHVIIVINIPADTQDQESITFSVTATALDAAETAALVEVTNKALDDAVTPADAVDIIFADGALITGSAGVDGEEDGKHTDFSFLKVTSADLSVTKTVTIVNEVTQGPADFDCTTDAATVNDIDGAIPGACLEYTIAVTNGGAAAEDATDVVISDNLPVGVTFSAIMGKVNWSNAAFTPGAPGTPGSIAATHDGPITPGLTSNLVFRVTVD